MVRQLPTRPARASQCSRDLRGFCVEVAVELGGEVGAKAGDDERAQTGEDHGDGDDRPGGETSPDRDAAHCGSST